MNNTRYVWTKKNWNAGQTFFVEDCRYRVTARENYDQKLPYGLIYCINKNMLKDRVLALRQTTMYEPRSLRHFVSGIRVRGCHF